VPRIAAAHHEVEPFSIDSAPLPPPNYLSEEQAGDWRRLVSSFNGLGPGSEPVLAELVRAQSRARQLAENLSELRKRTLTSDSKDGTKQRSIFLQLHRAHMAESHLISVLSVKLKLTGPSRHGKHAHEAVQRPTAVSTPPWAQQ
jgi:hypothetical protein